MEVNLIMTDQTLLGYGDGADEPAHVIGGGAIPADLARRMVLDSGDDAAVFLRRLYTDPSTGQLAAMDSSARFFTANQRKFLVLRDQVCRTPWCDAPVRHADHVVSAVEGGQTVVDGGQGLCEACNYAKQAPGWQQAPAGHSIVTTTPTGHRYVSEEPHPPGWRPPPSSIEVEFRWRHLRAA